MEQVAPAQRRYTIAEYFRLSAETDRRLEYYDGVIVAMAGASPEHGLIGSNVSRELGNRLKASSCSTLDASVQVRLGRRALYSHPDVTVVCGPIDRDPADKSGNAILNPTVVVEVLSPSTERYDRTLKFERYQGIESLREYVLVAQDEPFVTTYYRSEAGIWSFGPTVKGLDGTVHLASLGIDLPLAEVYARVTFPDRPTPAEPMSIPPDDGPG